MPIADAHLHYVEFSKRPFPTLLFVHGLGTSSSSWVNILPAFNNRFHIIAPDLPGFGLSTLPDGRPFFTIEEYNAVLQQFVESTLPVQFTLIGHSLGGWLSIHLAARIPERISQLILINPAGISYPGVEEQKKLFTISEVNDVRNLLNRLWHHYPWYFKPFLPAIYHDLQRRSVSEFVANIRERDFVTGSLDGLSMPVTLVWGKEDRLLSWHSVQILRKRVPGVQLRTIDMCGHVPQLERPVALRSILEEVLQKGWLHSYASDSSVSRSSTS
jgi:pimeloyl-ACP methyl ester carboxylesterase